MGMRLRLAVACSALIALAGCGGESGTTDDEEPRGSNAQLEGDSPLPEDEAASPSEEPEEPPTFGETYTWDNGLSVKIGEPQDFTPSEYAAFDQAPNYRTFEITIVNNTGAQVDAAGAYVSVQSGDQEMSEVFDTDNGLDGSPTTPILDGRQTRYLIGFGIQRPDDIVMQFDPGQYEPELLEPVVFASVP